ALWCALLVSAPSLHWRDTARITAASSWSAAIGLGLFALWFVIDPDPTAVWDEFVVGENAGKVSGEKG
ncbi:MAG: hypothetical protein K9J77_12400, partial [Rhodoferax sp.]|nr:hypothetical protein [Rhodoferax sp.]